MSAPNEGTVSFNSSGKATFTPLSTAEYNAWAVANNQPQTSTPSGTAQYNAINAMVNATRVGGVNGPLPTDFFHTPLPQGFAAKNANSFDITTLSGFKLYRLRQAYGNGFGQLRELGQPRYIQFGLKIYF